MCARAFVSMSPRVESMKITGQVASVYCLGTVRTTIGNIPIYKTAPLIV